MRYLLFALIAVFILFLNIFPNYYASLETPEGKVFSGQASWFDPWDINVYVGAIKYGADHGFLLENIYTTTAHSPILYYFTYTLAGLLFKTTNPFLLFQILAAITGVLLLFTLWRASKLFVSSENQAIFITLLTALGGGFGWLFFPNFSSSDLFITGFTFLSHFQRPHEAVGVILYILSLSLFYLFTQNNQLKWAFFSSLALTILMLFYPFYLLSFGVILSIFIIFLLKQRSSIKILYYFFATLFIPVLAFLIYYSHLNSSLVFGGVLGQKLSIPNILEITSGYGILLPLLLYQLRQRQTSGTLFLNIWFFVSLLLIFLPLGFSRFYLRTLFFPVVILSVLSLKKLSSDFKIPSKVLIAALLTLVPFSSFYITYKRMEEVDKGNHWYYLSEQENKAINFLKEKKNGGGVLAGYTLGNIIPATSGNKVYFGHLIQTPKSEEKVQNMMKFYANMLSDDEAKVFLEENKIKYIIYGNDESSITQKYNKQSKLKYPFLKTAFKEKGIFIYSY